MKNNIRKFIYIFLVVVTVSFLCCCNKRSGEENLIHTMNADDSVKLEDVLTKEYDINELKVFFKDSFLNESSSINPALTSLSFDEVNQKFPVEIVRSGGYSVYKVIGGGFFYVFWVNVLDSSTDVTEYKADLFGGKYNVCFSAYLKSPVSAEKFSTLSPGKSTAEDVKKIDPEFELSFLLSTGRYSYSLLSDGNIMQIEYFYHEDIHGYDDLIVKELKTVSRDSVPSRYSAIIPSDLPWYNDKEEY